MKQIAQAISWVFLPLFMPVYALLLVMFVPSNQDFFFNEDCMYTIPLSAKKALLSMFSVFCILAPGISYILLYKRQIISTIEMDDRKERGIPIIIMLIYCLLLYFLFIVKTDSSLVPKFVFSLPLSGVFVTSVFFLINIWKKVSIHAAGTGILTGFILAYILLHAQYELWIFALAIFVSGLVMSARLYLQKHTMSDLIVGWFTATFITFVVNYFY